MDFFYGTKTAPVEAGKKQPIESTGEGVVKKPIESTCEGVVKKPSESSGEAVAKRVRASELELREEKSVTRPNPLNDPDVITRMNNLHCLSIFLTSRAGSRVRVYLAGGDTYEGVLRNVGSDYFVVVGENTIVCPFTSLSSITIL